jgi:hypothetical protein
MQRRIFLVSAIGAALLAGTITTAHAADIKLLNVSYDPTRELYQEYNAAFAKYWKGKSGDNVTISQSHGGAGAQAYRGNCRHTLCSAWCPWLRSWLAIQCSASGCCPSPWWNSEGRTL